MAVIIGSSYLPPPVSADTTPALASPHPRLTPLLSWVPLFLKYLLIWLCQVLVGACGIQFSDQGWNPDPLHREPRVSATGSPGSPSSVFPALHNAPRAHTAGLQRLQTDSTPDGLRERNGEVGLVARWGHTSPCGFMMWAREGVLVRVGVMLGLGPQCLPLRRYQQPQANMGWAGGA